MKRLLLGLAAALALTAPAFAQGLSGAGCAAGAPCVPSTMTIGGGAGIGGVNLTSYGLAKVGRGVAIGAPTGTPSAVTNGAGVLTGVYQYAYTETDGVGETSLSPAGSVTLSSNQALVTVPEPRRGTSQRRLYRTKAGGSTFYLVNDFGGAGGYFQTQWVDNTPDSSLVTQAPSSDTTNLFAFELNNSVKFLRTAPDQANNPADLTVLTGNSGAVAGTYALDVYGEYFGRTYYGNTFGSLKTGTNGTHFLAQWQDVVDGGASPVTVWQVMPKGNVVITPQTLSDPSLADGMGEGLAVTTTAPTTPTATQVSNSVVNTGAGSAAFTQTALQALQQAGYTGSSATYAVRAGNATASTGTSIGVQGGATGAAAVNVGVNGITTGGTKNIGVFGTSANLDLATTALTWPGGITGAGLGASNGANTDDIAIFWDNTTVVGEITNNGGVNFQGLNANTSTTYDFGTFGKGNFRITANGNTSTDIGSTNNVPVNIKSNAVTAMTVNTDQSVTMAKGLQLAVTTVASLPACSTSTKGQLYMVTDASSPTYNATLTGGSSTITLAACNGTNWTAH